MVNVMVKIRYPGIQRGGKNKHACTMFVLFRLRPPSLAFRHELILWLRNIFVVAKTESVINWFLTMWSSQCEISLLKNELTKWKSINETRAAKYSKKHETVFEIISEGTALSSTCLISWCITFCSTSRETWKSVDKMSQALYWHLHTVLKG